MLRAIKARTVTKAAFIFFLFTIRMTFISSENDKIKKRSKKKKLRKVLEKAPKMKIKRVRSGGLIPKKKLYFWG